MQRSDDPQAADVFDFVDAFLAARERGEDPPLAYWLERFPSNQEAVAREWILLRSADSDAGAPEGAMFAAPIASGPDRIGPYRLIGELGRGGQGTVFLAEDTRILRRVALKVLASRFDTISDEKLRRFRREAEIIARLEHPSLCTVYEADLAGEVPYLAMRYIEGRTLADVLADARKQDDSSSRVQLDAGDETTPRAAEARFPPGSTLELNQVLLFFERAARALHAAHEAGVVHRDVKPGNVIVTTDGKPVLLDFGLARDERETDAARITESGEVFGTPAYMSPEQLEFSSDQLDRRTDVYSLGVALYEALTLHRPFEQAVRPALYTAIQTQPPPDPRSFNADLPTDVAVVLETALEKDRGRRYATALALAEDLRRIRQYEPIRARPAGIPVRFARWVRRHPALAAATIGTILSLSAGLAVALHLLDATNDALVAKDDALSVALGKHLAQRSVQLVSQDASAALALGVEAVERAPGYLTRSALYPALENCWLERVLGGEETAKLATSLEIAPQGGLVAAGFDDGLAIVWELDTGKRVARIALGRGQVDAIAWDPSGARLAVATRDGAVTFVDARTAIAAGQTQLSWPAPPADAPALDGTAAPARKSEDAFTKCVSFSPDGARCLVRTTSGSLVVVDAASATVAARRADCTDGRWLDAGTVLAVGRGERMLLDAGRLDGPPTHGFAGATTACDVAEDARRIAFGTPEGDVQIDDASNLQAMARVHIPGGPVRCLDLAPTGDRVAVLVGRDEDVRPWIWTPGADPIELVGHGRRTISCARFSPDGTRVATASHDLSVRVWDAQTGTLQHTFTLPLRHVDVRWSPDGDRLISRSVFLIAHVWFARPRADTFDLFGTGAAVQSLEVAPDGTRVLGSTADGTAIVWPLAPDRRVGSRPIPGAPRHIMDHGRSLVAARVLGGAKAVVTAGADPGVRVWDAESGWPIGEALDVPAGVASIEVGGGDGVAILDKAGAVRVWHPLETPQRVELVHSPRDGERATCASYLQDGRRLAIGCSDGTLWIRGDAADTRGASRSFARGAQDAAILALAVHPLRDELAVACGDKRVRFWRVGDEAESRPEAFTFDLRSIAWDPRGERVLTLGRMGGNAARVIELARDEMVRPRNPHTGDITCAAFSPDGTLALTGASDGSLFVWSTKDGEPLVQREDLGAAVRCALFVPRAEGLSIVAGLSNGRVCVWPVDPLAAARKRMPRQLLSWERDRERALAAPLPYD